MTRFVAIVLLILVTAIIPALAHEGHHKGEMLELKALGLSQQVDTLKYCQGLYEVTMKDGTTQKYKEFDLRFKTDAGSSGPKTGTPILLSSGMGGDRAFVIFADPDEMRLIRKVC